MLRRDYSKLQSLRNQSSSTMVCSTRRLERELAPEELSELRLQIALRQSVEHSPTLATPVERHHEAGLLLGASPPGLSQTNRPVPPARRSCLLLECWISGFQINEPYAKSHIGVLGSRWVRMVLTHAS